MAAASADAELEGEKLPLDKSVKLYEEGVKLAAKCASELESAKRKIKILEFSSKLPRLGHIRKK